MMRTDILTVFLIGLFILVEFILLVKHREYRKRLRRLYGTGRVYDIQTASYRMYFLRFLLFLFPVAALLFVMR